VAGAGSGAWLEGDGDENIALGVASALMGVRSAGGGLHATSALNAASLRAVTALIGG
jgi:hypothetical protein